jgi:hypothetical protein
VVFVGMNRLNARPMRLPTTMANVLTKVPSINSPREFGIRLKATGNRGTRLKLKLPPTPFLQLVSGKLSQVARKNKDLWACGILSIVPLQSKAEIHRCCALGPIERKFFPVIPRSAVEIMRC